MEASNRKPRWRRRWLGLTLGTLLAAAVAGILLATPGNPRLWIKLYLRHPFDRTERLDLSRASQFYDLPRIGEHFVFDEVALLLNRPYLERPLEWPEHPAGAFTLRTNGLGLREDGPLADDPDSVRILVAGDSHTSGFVDNPDTFPNVCEARLGEDPDLLPVEVLNAGVAYTGPSAHLGAFEKFLDLGPDVFVATLFTGNDFADELRLQYLLDGWTWPAGRGSYMERVLEGQEYFAAGMAQGFNQAVRWQEYPQEAEGALDLVVETYLTMARRCEEEEVTFLALVLPTKMDVDTPGQEEVRLAEILGLGTEDVTINRRLAAEFTERLRSAGVEVLDPLAEMRARPDELYWRSDFHLGLSGHRFLGELLAGRLVELGVLSR